MGELSKLRPDRDLQCYFERPSAVAALSDCTGTGFTVSGCFRQQFDWAVVEWNRDNVFEHASLRPLPDGDLSGLRLSYEEERQNCMPPDSSLWPTVDWPYLRIWATAADGVERVYKVRLTGTPVVGYYRPAQATFELSGTITAGDYVELAWEAGDGVPSWLRHAAHMIYYDDTIEGVASILAGAIADNCPQTGMDAQADGPRISLRYLAEMGANGNRVGVYSGASGAQTLGWQTSSQLLCGGTSPTKWRIELDFSDLWGYEGPDFHQLAKVPTNAVRKMRWTWAPAEQSGDFVPSEFRVKITNWSAAGVAPYQVAGPGSRRTEDDSGFLRYSGEWDHPARGNYSGGSIRATATPGASVAYDYASIETHALYLGTRKFRNSSGAGAKVAVSVDGSIQIIDLAYAGDEDSLVRIKLADLAPGDHSVTATHADAGVFYFDFFEVACPTAELPDFSDVDRVTLATDWDTDHSIALAPERTAWLIRKLGFRGRANHYAGALWFYEVTRPGHVYASASVSFSGTPEFGKYSRVRVASAVFEHLNLITDTTESVVQALECAINAGATAVWASAEGNYLIIRSRTMGSAGNDMEIAADTDGSTELTVTISGPLSGGADGDVTSIPWAQGWRTDLNAIPRINRAARDWHRSYFRALREFGIDAASAFSMELQHGDPLAATGIAQRYPDGGAALLTTPALQTNFSPISLAFWRQAYKEMADLMREAGMTPFLQFGEVQWWYFASDAGMPFYDEYTKSAFRVHFGRAMREIRSQYSRPEDFPEECVFLQGLIGEFTASVMAYVRSAHPDARFEVLYPPDTNDTPLNRSVNFPATYWTPTELTCLKTENFTYTGLRDLNRIRESLQFPEQFGFSAAQRSHLVGIGDYTAPWLKEVRLALEQDVESAVLFALDQFCLTTCSTILEQASKRALFLGD